MALTESIHTQYALCDNVLYTQHCRLFIMARLKKHLCWWSGGVAILINFRWREEKEEEKLGIVFLQKEEK